MSYVSSACVLFATSLFNRRTTTYVTDNKTTFDTIRMYNNRFSGAPRPVS